MLKFNGYYLTEPLEVYHGRAKGRSSYLFNAYLFEKTGTLKIMVKHKFLENLSDFTQADFPDALCKICKYRVEGNQVIIEPSSQFERESSFEFSFENEFKISSTNDKLTFVDWNTINNMSESDINSAALIKSLYGPFYHKKYKVYFE